jgi:hypothetical protein
MRELSTDRPDTTESPYTVDAGHVQLEMSFFDHTSDKPSGGARVSTTSVAPVLLKVGLHDNVDLQLGLDPWTTSKATGGAATEGFGDTLVRLKINLWGNDEGRTAFALMPFVTVPTAADGLGVSAVEGGLIALLGVALDEEWALGLMAEVDLVTSPDGEDYVADFLHTATVGRGIVGDLGGYVEYAGFVHLHGKEDYRAYFDAGLTYALDPEVQLDAGVRVGLTEASEDLGFFTGLSLRR